MAYLHERNLVHGDLKTSNLLVEDNHQRVAISDFGLSRFEGQAVGTNAFTVGISPPEVLQDRNAMRTAAGDSYAFGIVLWEMLKGRQAYQGLTSSQIMTLVTQGDRPEIPAHCPGPVASMIQDCWQQDPAFRPTFASLVSRLTANLPVQDDHGTTTTGY